MGIFDEAIKQEQNRPDLKGMEKIRKLKEEDAERMAHAEAAAKLLPYVRTALAEFPDACRKMGCEYLTIFVYRKPGFFRNKEYEKWNGIPVYQSPYNDFLIFIHDGRYFVNASKWNCQTGTNELYLIGKKNAPLVVYPDRLPRPAEITRDEAVQKIADNMVSWLREKERSGADHTGPLSSDPKGDLLTELHLLMIKAFRAYMNKEYEQTVTLFFMHSFRQMQARKNSRIDILIKQY